MCFASASSICSASAHASFARSCQCSSLSMSHMASLPICSAHHPVFTTTPLVKALHCFGWLMANTLSAFVQASRTCSRPQILRSDPGRAAARLLERVVAPLCVTNVAQPFSFVFAAVGSSYFRGSDLARSDCCQLMELALQLGRLGGYRYCCWRTHRSHCQWSRRD